MATGVLGRTNRTFPMVWLRLATGPDLSPKALVEAALAKDTVLDISLNPALWGGQMRGTDALLMTIGGQEIHRATSRNHAADLIQAHLIETLSAIGREWIDFYFLAAEHALTDFQVEGALEALESAVQEGHVRHLGLACSDADAAWAIWRNHDAFEVALLLNDMSEPDLESLENHASSKRVGVIKLGNAPEGQIALQTFHPAVELGMSA